MLGGGRGGSPSEGPGAADGRNEFTVGAVCWMAAAGAGGAGNIVGGVRVIGDDVPPLLPADRPKSACELRRKEILPEREKKFIARRANKGLAGCSPNTLGAMPRADGRPSREPSSLRAAENDSSFLGTAKRRGQQSPIHTINEENLGRCVCVCVSCATHARRCFFAIVAHDGVY